MDRKQYAIRCAITIALGAAVGMLGFFVTEPATHAKDQIISFDIACVKAELTAHKQGTDIVTNCEVSHSKLIKAMAKFLSPATSLRQGMRPSGHLASPKPLRVLDTTGDARAGFPTMSDKGDEVKKPVPDEKGNVYDDESPQDDGTNLSDQMKQKMVDESRDLGGDPMSKNPFLKVFIGVGIFVLLGAVAYYSGLAEGAGTGLTGISTGDRLQ